MESRASKEKNATVIRPIPTHIHATRAARHTNCIRAAGRKSWTSPRAFIARETHNSPPVPAPITRNRKISSSTFIVSPEPAGGYRLQSARQGKSRQCPTSATDLPFHREPTTREWPQSRRKRRTQAERNCNPPRSAPARSEERRVGKESRSRCGTYQKK